MPSPTHLVGLEIIVQRKLQFAQVLWLLLLLAFTLSFGQARLCIVIILELRAGRKGLRERQQPPFTNSDSEPLWGELRCQESQYKADHRNQHDMGERLIREPSGRHPARTWKT